MIALVATACGSTPADEGDTDSKTQGSTATPQGPGSSVAQTPSGSDGDRSADLSFSLLSTNGGVVSFNDLRGMVPLSVFFFGGSSCLGCDGKLQSLQNVYSRLKEIGAEVIAISTNPPEQNRTTVDELGIEFPVLTDSDGSVSERWGVFNLLGNQHAAPAMFVFDSSGDEIARKIGASASELPDVDETLQVIQRSLESGTAATTATPPTSGQPSAGQSNNAGLGPGVTDFKLPDAISGGEIGLSETLQDRHVVLVFYRAFW